MTPINVTDTRTQTAAEIARLQADMRENPKTDKPASRLKTVLELKRQRSDVLDGGAVSHWSGLTFVNMTPKLGQYFGAETGVLLVHSRDKDLPLMEGDVILKIGKRAPADASQAVTMLRDYRPGEPVALEIWRYRRSLLLEFELKQSIDPE